MAFVLAYTKPGIGIYDNRSYPGHIGYVCDIEHAMHLAISDDGENFTALRNNTGILYPKATFTEGPWPGTTKTLQYPWIFRMADGSFGVASVRRNQNAPDPLSVGCMMLFTSKNLVRYEEDCFLKLSDGEVKNPRVRWEAEKDAYYVEWEAEDGLFCGYTKYFKEIRDVKPCEAPTFEAAADYGIEGCIPGNIIEVSAAEAKVIRQHFDVIENVGVAPLELTVEAGKAPCFDKLPWATLLYSDDSTHDKIVNWDKAAFDAIDFNKPGEYEVPGEVFMRHWPFPMPLSDPPADAYVRRKNGGMSDPCITYYNGKYYLTSSGAEDVIIRVSDKIENVHAAPAKVIFRMPALPNGMHGSSCAAELHIIKGVPYIFTSNRPDNNWWTVRCCVLRCNGDIEDINAWEGPFPCVKANGAPMTEDGLSIDVTYFQVEGVHYAMWSDRKCHLYDGKFIERVSPEPADIYLAAIDPDKPWQLITEPVCIIRPIYGWDRCETEVDEGPYLLRRGDDLFITVAGSSTGMADLYDLGFIRAKVGTNLLDPKSWDWIPYPFLTKESVPGEWGPGHNNFVTDPLNGDTLMSYHAVPHDEDGLSLGRKPGVRRVHWAATGLPYLEMTEDRDLKPEFKNVTLKITVK